MATVKYDVGDILTLREDGNCYATAVIVRWHTKDVYVEGINLKRYTEYDLFIKSEGRDNFGLLHDVSEYMLFNYKVVGHIDISGMPNDEVKTHLDHAIARKWYEGEICHAIAAYWALMKLREPKEESEYVNPFYYDNLADKLAEECKQKQKHLDLANNKIFELKKEVDSLRQAPLSKSEAKAHTRLNRITFLTRKVDELENAIKKQKAECDEANREIDRLRTVIGGLNDVIDDLNTSKVEMSDLFSSLKTVLQIDDILEGVNKLKKENERLSNENRDLKTINAELRKSIPEYNKLVLKHFSCTEKSKKLEDENARYLQSMTCAEKQMTEAAQRIHEAMEHLNAAICND